MRALVAAVLLLAAAAPESSLGRLADAIAGEILRVSAGRPLDLSPADDRTGLGALGADLQALVRSRLDGRVPLAGTGPRLAVTSVLAQVGTRLVWSGRIVEEPSGTLVDVVSVSGPWDPALLPLVASRGAGSEGVDVLERTATPPIEGRIVALAFAGDQRLLVLFDDALASYRRDGLALRLDSRRDVPGPLAPVRFPGGVLRAAEGESACWALTSRASRAILFTVEGSRLTPTHQADALPWPRAAAGARFRPGTNLIDVALPGVEGPVLAMEPDAGWVVDADGGLARAGRASGPEAGRGRAAARTGAAVALLWPGLLAAAAPDPPGERDRIVLLRETDASVAGSLPVDGAVRALAARRQGGGALLAAALEDPAGGFRIALFSLAERK